MRASNRLPVVFDMESGDPDDLLCLILLLGHPGVDLQAVAVTPGTPHQIGIVHKVLCDFDADLSIPIGAFNIDHKKARGTPDERYVTCVSDWHYKFLGDVKPMSAGVAPGFEVLNDHLDERTTLCTGAPLKNLGAYLRHNTPRIIDHNPQFRWVAQGGFAGEGVVPPEQQLDKFKGMRTCPTYNLNGDPKSALLALESNLIRERRFVSKNVCHGVVYDQELHDKVRARIDELGTDNEHGFSLDYLWRGMDLYLRKRPAGKAFHDPLAACCAIDPSIGTWADVRLFREKGQWGSELAEPGQENAIILTGYNHDRFINVLLGREHTDAKETRA